MNSHIILLGVLLCLLAVGARHMDALDNLEDSGNSFKAKPNAGERHRRKRYHMSYGYDYQPPANPFYHSYREHDRNQDLLPEIYRLLDEISTYIRRPPPPPPQPIYIPYAVPYPICNCATNNAKPTKDQPDITNRFHSMEDTNQNWGIVDEGTAEEEGDGSRPLSFIPIIPKRPMKRPQPPVEHGTQHERAPPSTQAPSFAQPHIPDMCDVFSLSCCSGNDTQKKRCFADAGCTDTYNRGDVCNPDRLLKIIEEYSKAYAPTVN